MFKSANGISVTLHPDGHPHRTDLLEETISKVTLPEDGTFFFTTVDLGHVIGIDHLVETNKDSKVVYINRPLQGQPGKFRAGKTPMVINQQAPETTKVSIGLCVATDPAEYAGKWVVFTLFEGEQGMPEPWDRKCQNNPELARKSYQFWKTHALVPTAEEWPVIANTLFDMWEEATSGDD